MDSETEAAAITAMAALCTFDISDSPLDAIAASSRDRARRCDIRRLLKRRLDEGPIYSGALKISSVTEDRDVQWADGGLHHARVADDQETRLFSQSAGGENEPC
jgi:hypothetical protein